MTAETGPAPGRPAPLDFGLVVALVGSLCLLYTVSQFLRNSVGVLAPELSGELGLSPPDLGLLSGVFFLAFASVQLPLGILIDRYGPRRAMLGSLVLALFGIGLFAMADSLAGLVAGRAFMGLGCSSFLMGPLAVYARWFPQSRFSTLTGLQIGLGTLGTLVATAPLAYAAAAIGWRMSFLAVAGFAALTGLLVLLLVRDDPPGAAPRPRSLEPLSHSIRGVLDALRMPDVAPLFAMHFASYAAVATVLGLWGGPYLADVYGLSLERRGDVLLILTLASVVGSLAWGPADRWFGSRKRPVATGAAASIAALCGLAFFHPPLIAIPFLFAAFGFASGYVSVQIAHGRALFPDRLVGRGMTLLNAATMSGTFALQILTGGVVGFFDAAEAGGRPLAAYQAAFGTTAAWLALALLLYSRAADRPPR